MKHFHFLTQHENISCLPLTPPSMAASIETKTGWLIALARRPDVRCEGCTGHKCGYPSQPWLRWINPLACSPDERHIGPRRQRSLRSFPVTQRALSIVSVGIFPHLASQPVSPADLYGAARCDLLPDGTSDGDRPPRRRVAAACVRLLTRSFAKRLCTCTFTVCSESAILCAISLF